MPPRTQQAAVDRSREKEHGCSHEFSDAMKDSESVMNSTRRQSHKRQPSIMASRLSFVALMLFALMIASCSALAPQSVNRRQALATLGGGAATLSVLPPPAAAKNDQEQKDRENIVKGYQRLQYLLDNWEKETTVCKTGQETTFGDKCERTPLKVMDYLGFRSINDPLFKADQAMMRLKAYVPSDSEVEFYEAVEKFAENAEEASSMAFISSWGEANPGGGKDRVILFIERAKKNVISSRDSLKAVIDILKL